MKPYARREDGALLIVDDVSEANPVAQIVSRDGTWTTTLQAALARGEWVAVDGQEEAETASGLVDRYRVALSHIASRIAFHLPGKHDQENHGDGDGVDVIPGDKLKLAGRIALKPGEKLLSSQRTRSGQWDVLTAEIDTPDGRQVRLGVIDPADRRKWTAGPDPKRAERVRQLEKQLDDMEKAGKEDTDEYEKVRDELDELTSESAEINRTTALTPEKVGQLRSDIEAAIDKARAMIAQDERPESGEFASGVIPGGLDGDVDWRLDDAGTGEEDDWVLWLAIRPHGEGDDWLPDGDDTATFDRKSVKPFLGTLGDLASR